VNIDAELQARESFSEVRETAKRIHMIRCNSAQKGVDNKLPSNYKKNKKLLKTNRDNAYESSEHASNLANL
jgi:hypothetical protein